MIFVHHTPYDYPGIYKFAGVTKQVTLLADTVCLLSGTNRCIHGYTPYKGVAGESFFAGTILNCKEDLPLSGSVVSSVLNPMTQTS